MNKSLLTLLITFFGTLSLPLSADFPIICQGRTQITYQPSQQPAKCITCYAPVHVDWENKTITCHRSKINSQPQIKMIDDVKELYANHLNIHFEANNHRLSLNTLELFGEVKLLQKEYDPDSQKVLSQYILADSLNYNAQTGEIDLFADKGRQVYYYDEINAYEMNAEALQLTTHKESHKSTLAGKGAVHFTFKEDYLKEIENRIKLSHKPAKSKHE